MDYDPSCVHGRGGFCHPCRAAEKQRSRDQDAADLASGRKTAEQLRQENNAFGFPRDRVIVHYDGRAEPLEPEWKRLAAEAKRLMDAGLLPPEQMPGSRAQRISFAFGNVAMHNPNLTREDVERAVDEMDRREMERLRAIEKAARRWYGVQRGTMASLSSTGLALKEALEKK